MNRSRDRASAAGLLPRMEADDYSEEWRPWKAVGMRPCDWMDANWRMFLHGPDVLAASVVPDKASSVSGVYFLFKAGHLVYIGESVNTEYRIFQHTRGDKAFDAVWSFATPELYRRGIEAAYIDALGPYFNAKSHGSGVPGMSCAIKELWK